MSEKQITHSVRLTEQELLLLDGKCSDEVQATIDTVKAHQSQEMSIDGCSPKEARFVSKAIDTAKKEGKLTCSYVPIRTCQVCDTFGGYFLYKRNSRWHKAGETDRSKPKYLSGVELADSSLRIVGQPWLGCCNTCWVKLKGIVAEHVKDIPAEISKHILDIETGLKKVKKLHCNNCQWEGHEKQAEQKYDSLNRDKCPKCGSINQFLRNNIITPVPGFVIIDKDNNVVREQLKDQT